MSNANAYAAPEATAEAPSKWRTRPDESSGWPKGVLYIVGNEACERFSFYGMKAILWVYMAAMFGQQMAQGAADAQATERVHLFIAGVYAFPMIGAIIADRLLGKYNTILWVSLVYCAGHAVLSVSDFAPGLVGGTEYGLYLGLALIAVGSGGIKPCVSANVGDQFGSKNAHLVTKVYQIFYFSINFGSFGSTLLTPWLLDKYGPAVAFGIPGVLMFIATAIFWLGRHNFVHVPPKPGGKLGALDAAGAIALFVAFIASPVFLPGSVALKVLVSVLALVVFAIAFVSRTKIEWGVGFIPSTLYAFLHQKDRAAGEGFFAPVRKRFGDEAAEGPPAVLRIFGVFAMVSVFWALFDQHSSSWINQAAQMDRNVWVPFKGAIELKASQLAALNPLMVMLIIPLLSFAVFPAIERAGLRLTPLRKMTAGMFLTALSFVAVALLQMRIDSAAALDQKVSVLWQIVPYLIITTAEVLVSVTGLEFGYTQAPRSMKSTIMGFWLLCVTFGNLLVAFLAGFKDLSLANFFWVFAGLMAVAATAFGVIAYFYRYRTFLQDSAAPKDAETEPA